MNLHIALEADKTEIERRRKRDEGDPRAEKKEKIQTKTVEARQCVLLNLNGIINKMFMLKI